MSFEFCEFCGDNVRVASSCKSAQWDYSYSGGLAFSLFLLRPGERVFLKVNGNGHASMGFTETKPGDINDFKKALQDDTLKLMTNIKSRKSSGQIKIAFSAAMVIVTCNGMEITQRTEATGGVYIFVNLKFGNLEAVLLNENGNRLPFHSKTAENIELIDNSIVQLKVEHPGCVVSLNRKLYPGESILFKLQAITENGRVPSSFSATLGASSLHPDVLRVRDPESFSVCHRIKKPKRWRRVQKFDASSSDNCTGYLQVMLTQDGKFKYAHSSLLHGHVTMPESQYHDGALIVLDLFRVSAEIVQASRMKEYDYVDLKTGEVKNGCCKPTKRGGLRDRTPSMRPKASGEDIYMSFVPRIKDLVSKMPSSGS